MATVTGFTADRMQQIEDNVITAADIVDGDLILIRYDGSQLNAGPIGTGLNPKGHWDNGETYIKGDLVFHDNKAWIAVGTTAAGDEPGVDNVWQEFVIDTTAEWTGPIDNDGTVEIALNHLTAHSDRNTTLELRGIRSKLASISSGGLAKIAIVGDSISRRKTWLQLRDDLCALYNPRRTPDKGGRRSLQTDVSGLVHDRLWDNRAGAWIDPKNSSGLAPGSTQMDPGEEASHTTYCDRFSLFVGVNSGVFDVFIDGDLVETVDATTNTESAPYGGFWHSPPLPWDEHTVKVVAGASGCKIHQSFFYSGNFSSGVQVWDLGASGATTEQMLNNNDDPILNVPTTFSFVSVLEADCVILAFGTNDVSTLANYTADPTRLDSYDTNTRALIAYFRSTLPEASLILWVPYAATGRTHWPLVQQVARDISRDTGVAIIDSFAQLGMAADAGLDLIPDGTHPGEKTYGLISNLATEALKTRETPLHVITTEPVWSNSTHLDPIDMGREFSLVTIEDAWAPDLIRGNPLSGQPRSSKMMVRSVTGSTITWPSDLNWEGVAPALTMGDWVLIEMVHLPGFGPLAWVVSEGQWVPNPSINIVDWYAAYRPQDASSNGDGNPLNSVWVDASGNLRDLDNIISAPTYVASHPHLNGQPAVTFNGAEVIRSQSLTGDTLAQPFSVVAFVAPTSSATQRIFCTVQGSGRGLGIQSVSNWAWQGSSTLRITGGTVTQNTPALIEAYANGTSSRLAVNGVEVATGDAGTDPINLISLGATGGATPQNYFFGALGFSGVMPGDHALDSDWQILRDSLAADYGITLS